MTFPVVAPAGTTATIVALLHEVYAVAAVPLNFTTDVPRAAPNFDPFIVTLAPIFPDTGVSDAILGVTEKTGALDMPDEVVTVTPPVVAVEGTFTTI